MRGWVSPPAQWPVPPPGKPLTSCQGQGRLPTGKGFSKETHQPSHSLGWGQNYLQKGGSECGALWPTLNAEEKRGSTADFTPAWASSGLGQGSAPCPLPEQPLLLVLTSMGCPVPTRAARGSCPCGGGSAVVLGARCWLRAAAKHWNEVAPCLCRGRSPRAHTTGVSSSPTEMGQEGGSVSAGHSCDGAS